MIAPAMSVDRLRIHYGNKSVMISPGLREAFVAELARRAGLSPDGDEGLVRGPLIPYRT